jgi:hypothetical protein
MPIAVTDMARANKLTYPVSKLEGAEIPSVFQSLICVPATYTN